MISTYRTYIKDLCDRFWRYQRNNFPDKQHYLDTRYTKDKGNPPVFLYEKAGNNIITDPDGSSEMKARLLAYIPRSEQHRWYRSMSSSQALAQCVFGNLAVSDNLAILRDLADDNGDLLFGSASTSSDHFHMEHNIDYLNEPRQTSLDGYVSGDYRLAIECKLTEHEVGACSRPRLEPESRDYCDGSYTIQGNRQSRCSLTEIGIRYWYYIPKLFKCVDNTDLAECPIRKSYQLVRNLLAVGVSSDGKVSLNNGHAILVYDNRNPSFQDGGAGYIAFTDTKKSLKSESMIRKCSWQRIIQHIRDKHILPWLTSSLYDKYGF